MPVQIHSVRGFLCQNAVSVQVLPTYGEHLEENSKFSYEEGERIENLRLCESVIH